MEEQDRLLQWNTGHNESRPMEKLTDIELTKIVSTTAEPRPLLAGIAEVSSVIIQEDDIPTSHGNVRVAVQGDKSKPAILTFHDIGLNHGTCFQGFFSFMDMQPILKHFAVYHMNAPGQEEGAKQLPNDYAYPNMEQMTDLILTVLDHYNLKRIIGIGVGSGANILTRFAMAHQNRVDALVLINPTCKATGWVEWGYQKMNSWYLFSGQMTNFTHEYLLWHWFGQKTRWNNHDLVTVYKQYMKSVNVQNLALFIQSYIRRTDMGLIRELAPVKKSGAKSVKCRCLLLVGDDSPHIENVVDMNSRMDPQETDFMKIADCGGMPIEEQPGKVCEAFKLFLQGMGYVPTLKQRKSAAAAAHSAIHRKSQDITAQLSTRQISVQSQINNNELADRLAAI